MPAGSYKTPGVYISQVKVSPGVELRTGVPVFIGYAGDGAEHPLQEIARWSDFQGTFGGEMPQNGYLAYAVRGFFSNGGRLCYVKAIDRSADPDVVLRQALDKLRQDRLMEEIDLVCAPDLMLFPEKAPALQQAILDFCSRGSGSGDGRWFAVLDALPGSDTEQVCHQRDLLAGENGALYYPWICLGDGPSDLSLLPAGTTAGFVPPCGHIAGIYTKSDNATGVHKAPANEVIEEAIDLEVILTNADQDQLNPRRVNCLRSFPGRGIRVWGARTLSGNPDWMYVNVRRVFLTVCRWLEKTMTGFAFEPHSPNLWLRISREVQIYLTNLYRRGFFSGKTMEEAFYVKCDEETNPPEVRDAGQVVTEVGLAIAAPAEFIIIRIIQSDGGVTFAQSSTGDTNGETDGGGSVTPTPQPVIKPDIAIIEIKADVPGPDVAGEYVAIRNDGASPVDLTNWVLSDTAGHQFVFPTFTLAPKADVKIWTKVGTNTATDLYWNSGTALWNNTGDAASLIDSQNHPIADYTYKGTK